MIYLAYRDQSLFALYNGIMIRCVEIPNTWMLIQDIIDHAHVMSTIERQQAHYLPEHRGMHWALKIPYTRSYWDHLIIHSVIVNRPEEVTV